MNGTRTEELNRIWENPDKRMTLAHILSGVWMKGVHKVTVYFLRFRGIIVYSSPSTPQSYPLPNSS